MTSTNTRKFKIIFTVEQRLEYAKLMVDEGYSNKQVMEISGVGASAVTRFFSCLTGICAGSVVMPE